MTDWKDKNQSTHLKYIRHYLLSKILLAHQLFRPYQKKLLQVEIKVNNGTIQMNFRLSMIVIKKRDKLVIFNKKYQKIVNQDCV
ncbi:MAG: hypothetical protein O4807_04420 [Trichodesmium sp. St19_bin2]|nr:hypothetical protein [Trichodesmium sp. St5_bin8]MDE5102240.1 hypothetical protein [Trichodesmium sp. St19_bin2]